MPRGRDDQGQAVRRLVAVLPGKADDVTLVVSVRRPEHGWRSRARQGSSFSGRYAFAAVWTAATLGLGWLVLSGQRSFDSPMLLPALVLGLAATVALLWWLPGPTAPSAAGATHTQIGRLVLAGALAEAILVALVGVAGKPLLFAFPLAALAALIFLRRRPSPPELAYAAALAVVAGVAGLGLGRITYVSPGVWAGLQVALLLTCLPAGWAILRATGLLDAGVGQSLYLTAGLRRALVGFAEGMGLSLPWALLNVALGAAQGETWVTRWWQPLTAIQPGVAEEAWGRVFLVPVLFLALRRLAPSRAALAAAVVVAGYWFAYLHTSGGLAALPSTLLVGTAFCLPLSYVWLRRGLEPAMGFHFAMDFLRFAVAYLLQAPG